jgi:hypothetical protein
MYTKHRHEQGHARKAWPGGWLDPQSRQSVPPPPHFGSGGRGTLAGKRGRGWESPNSDEGTYTVVLYIYMYFVGIPSLSDHTCPCYLCKNSYEAVGEVCLVFINGEQLVVVGGGGWHFLPS